MHINNIIQLAVLISFSKGQSSRPSGTIASAPPSAPTSQPKLVPITNPPSSNPPPVQAPAPAPAPAVPEDNQSAGSQSDPGNGYYVYTPNAVNNAYSSFRIPDLLFVILAAF
jgi:hypothetical protein